MDITRRQALKYGIGAAVVGGVSYTGYVGLRDYTDLFVDDLYPYVLPTSYWGSSELTAFLGHLRNDERKLITSSLGISMDAYNVGEIKKQVMWLASNALAYPFVEKQDYNFHSEILKWLATEYGVEDYYRLVAPSFALERKILDALFVKIWNNLNFTQRAQVLQAVDKDNRLADKAGITAMGGAAALGVLSATVYFTGFAFYTTMSIVIYTVAGVFGLTIPFAAYTGAVSTLALLSGPVGWALGGLAALASVALLGRANVGKTAAFVTQLHLIKVQSLQNSHRLDQTLTTLKQLHFI